MSWAGIILALLLCLKADIIKPTIPPRHLQKCKCKRVHIRPCTETLLDGTGRHSCLVKQWHTTCSLSSNIQRSNVRRLALHLMQHADRTHHDKAEYLTGEHKTEPKYSPSVAQNHASTAVLFCQGLAIGKYPCGYT